jgi:acyl-CoA synthetase (AMP-forming)/AMP-acid ligase II
MTLGGFLGEVCAAHRAREALVFDDPLQGGATVRWSYADLDREARAVAARLVVRGVAPGDRVGLVMGNRPELVAAIFGVALAGAVVVPLSTFSTPGELVDLLQRSAVVGVLTQSALLDRALGAEIAALVGAPGLPALVWSIAVDAPKWRAPVADADTVDREVARRAAAVSPDDPGLVLFSSGTTSEPKGMVHLHRAPTFQCWVNADVFRRTPSSRVWAPLPLFWTAGLTTAMGPTLAGGGCFVLQEVFDAGDALQLIARERVTEPYTLPHQAAALAEHPNWATTDLSSLREVYGKSVFTRHPSVRGDTSWTMPLGYGMSETCASVASHRWSNTREEMQASTGRLLPGARLRVVDPDTGAQLGPGVDGELCVAGPTVLDHYLGKTRGQTVDADGFLHTGDMGYVDDDGALHWTGRRTEIVKTGGANVSPAELEFALRACPEVRRTKVIGLPDARMGEVVVLCAERAVDAHPTESGLQTFLRERVASYKVPRHVLLFEPGELPSTASDTKVRDDALAALASALLAEREVGREVEPSDPAGVGAEQPGDAASPDDRGELREGAAAPDG